MNTSLQQNHTHTKEQFALKVIRLLVLLTMVVTLLLFQNKSLNAQSNTSTTEIKQEGGGMIELMPDRSEETNDGNAFKNDDGKEDIKQETGGMIELMPKSGIEETTKQILSLQTYPNPTTDFLNIELEVNERQIVEIQLINIVGSVLQEKQIEMYTGTNNITWDVSRLYSGVYYLSVQVGDEILARKIRVVQ